MSGVRGFVAWRPWWRRWESGWRAYDAEGRVVAERRSGRVHREWERAARHADHLATVEMVRLAAQRRMDRG